MNTGLWLVRREFWENKAIWIIPASIGVLLTLASLFGTVEISLLGSIDPTRSMAGMLFFGFGAAFYTAMSLYSYWYLLDCLYAERRDRSILFWKSLPLSDAQTVLSKLFVALVAIPLVYFAAADASCLVAAFVLAVRAHSALGEELWQPSAWLQMQAVWLYVIGTTALWYLPISGWLLVVSAWAGRAVMLWSILPPLGVMLAERLFIGTHYASSMITERLFGYAQRAFASPLGAVGAAGGLPGDPVFHRPTLWRLMNPGGFLAAPATWTGVLVGAGLVAAAVQIRARRAEA